MVTVQAVIDGNLAYTYVCRLYMHIEVRVLIGANALPLLPNGKFNHLKIQVLVTNPNVTFIVYTKLEGQRGRNDPVSTILRFPSFRFRYLPAFIDIIFLAVNFDIRTEKRSLHALLIPLPRIGRKGSD